MAQQLGTSFGTAVLGTVLASRVGTVLPRQWIAHHLPALPGPAAAKLKQAADVGIAPPASPRTPARITQAVADAIHTSFLSGMHWALIGAAIAATAAAAVALLIKPIETHGP
ncbi:hypothetical protein [Catenulispora rubra]|uniref:hypothetical protein n=1 Tax=Catenulispora rubra TaxID=280293 RepID=UPI0018923A9D|nr:hypothetical protein [Catenulispora rubra]